MDATSPFVAVVMSHTAVLHKPAFWPTHEVAFCSSICIRHPWKQCLRGSSGMSRLREPARQHFFELQPACTSASATATWQGNPGHSPFQQCPSRAIRSRPGLFAFVLCDLLSPRWPFKASGCSVAICRSQATSTAKLHCGCKIRLSCRTPGAYPTLTAANSC